MLQDAKTASSRDPAPEQRVIPSSARVASIDAYRGFVMLAMISAGMGLAGLKDDPRWGGLSRQFQHVEWEGWVFWDLIQPSFMFIVGAAMPFALARRRELGESWRRQLGHAVQRALMLILIGFVLDTYRFETPHLEFIRVLQQIAIGYLLAFVVLLLGPKIQLLAAAIALAVHSALFIAYGRSQDIDPWLKDQNVGAQLDLWLGLPINPWGTVVGNKGGYVTLNALSSAATILLGVLCGEILIRAWPVARKLLWLALAGAACIALGLVLEAIVPIPMVKKIWTASFALFAAGCTFWMMLGFYAIIDGIGWRRWAFPLTVVGMNSIAVYVFHELLHGNLQRMAKGFLGPVTSNLLQAGPVVLAVAVIVLEWGFCYWLYRRRIFFKV